MDLRIKMVSRTNLSRRKGFEQYVLIMFGCCCRYNRKTGVPMHQTSKSLTRTWNMMNESRSLTWKMRTKKFRKRKVSSFCPILTCQSSVLWHCWLGTRKGIRPVKNWWGAGVVICVEEGANYWHTVQLMPLPPLSSLASLKFRLV